VNFVPGEILLRSNSRQKCIYSPPAQVRAKHCAVWLASVERRRCSNETKTRKPLKLTGVPQTNETISAASRLSSPYCGDMWRKYCCLTSFFSDCRYVPQLGRYSPTKFFLPDMVNKRFSKLYDGDQTTIFWRLFASCISSEPRQYRPAF